MTNVGQETKKDRMYERIAKHGENLNRIFHTGITPVSLCKRLRRLETVAQKAAEDHCNVEGFDFDQAELEIMRKVNKILKYKENGIPVFLNGDPRGYALKIKDDWMRKNPLFPLHKDWGGFGIIAPDLSEE